MRIWAFILFFSTAVASFGQDWKQFRGSDGSGILDRSALPAKLVLDEHLAWKSPLPGRGLSSPVVIGDRVFVSCASGVDQDRLHIRCHAVEDGSLMWERQFWATGRTMCHPKTSVAAPTPASDGERLFVLFSSNDVICLDLDGRLQWLRGLTSDYPNASNSLGMASSPVVVGNTLVVQSENDSESFAVGLDAESGKNRWRIDRPKAANWTSPVVMDDAGKDRKLVVLQSSKGATAVDPATGEIVWNFSDGASTIPSSVVAGGILFVPSNGITALRPRSSEAEPELLWQSSRLRPSTPSPVVVGNKIFTVNQAGVVTCGSLQDGDRVWQLRLKGPFSGTPVGWGQYLYFVNEKGLLQVVDIDTEEGEIVSQIDLGETVLCTPALVDGALFVRSNQHLWKIAE
jgi:outer membrane protein assembly factor BamB